MLERNYKSGESENLGRSRPRLSHVTPVTAAVTCLRKKVISEAQLLNAWGCASSIRARYGLNGVSW